MTFSEYVETTIGKRPSFNKGQYSPECRAWDQKFVTLLNGGSAVPVPIYHPRRREQKVERTHE